MSTSTSSVSEAAVNLATFLIDQGVGRGIFRLHGIHDDRCACGDPDCANVGKHPAERWGTTCTRNPRAVEQKFRLYPDAGIGLATGRGLLVLDFDVDHCGLTSLRRLERRFPVLSTAPRVLTGSSYLGRGVHIYLCVLGDAYVPSRAGCLLPDYWGVDVRCAGGYVVAPPTLHLSDVAYQWEREPGPLPGCPDELVALMQQREVKDGTGGVDRERSGLPLFPDKVAMLRDGIPLDGGQRTNICSLARALLEVPRSVSDATDIIWAALQKSEWSKEPWTQEQVLEIVVDIETNSRRPALREVPRIRIKAKA